MKIIKGLVEKIKDALKEPTAEELFPNLMEYLKKEYGTLVVEKIPEQTNRETWIISKARPQMSCGTFSATPVGVIKSYMTERAAMSAEYGYKAEVITKGKKLELKCRKGYLVISCSEGFVFANNNLKRYDKEDIPFP